MLFNLNTIDACFLSSQWRITSTGMFAGSCIGVFILGMALEFLRRAIKEYDRYLVRQHLAQFQPTEASSVSSKDGMASRTVACAPVPSFRPNVWQQAVRALLHLLAFFVGYILMLVGGSIHDEVS